MTDTRGKKPRKLAWEILGLIGISAVLAAFLFMILSWVGTAIVESYCFENDIVMSEFDWLETDRWIFRVSALISAAGFSVLFLTLLGERMVYIRDINRRINALQQGQTIEPLPLEGRNELTQLAAAVNYMAATQQQLRQKEQALAREKEQFIRALSHDIRTPLTSILAYAQYMAEADSNLQPEQKSHLQTICKKALQIRDLTQLLLDGDKRSPERFDDAHLLMQQLAAEFEQVLEGRFILETDLSGCPGFPGVFDVQELRRIFDNLSSNVEKYADPARPVCLRIWVQEGAVCIRQSNGIRVDSDRADSYKLGIHSIRRIAQNYGGSVSVRKDDAEFCIDILLSDIS